MPSLPRILAAPRPAGPPPITSTLFAITKPPAKYLLKGAKPPKKLRT
jgi:hypothetical protein